MASITRPMTFEEFAKLPEPQGFRYELHNGELVEVTFPKMTHVRVRRRLRRLLERFAGDGAVEPEIGFLALPDYEFRIAVIVYVRKDRWETSTSDDYFHGPPDLVIEILSPSNSTREMREKRKLCLANGSVEFRVVESQTARSGSVHARWPICDVFGRAAYPVVFRSRREHCRLTRFSEHNYGSKRLIQSCREPSRGNQTWTL